MQITFREAIRLVHPDTNKNIQNAGEKVRTIMAFKNDPAKMYSFLRQWGLVPGNNGEFKKEVRFTREGLSHLIPNHNYAGEHVFVYHRKNRKASYGVARTTGKRVYFTKATVERTGKKYCDIGSVISAYIVKVVE